MNCEVSRRYAPLVATRVGRGQILQPRSGLMSLAVGLWSLKNKCGNGLRLIPPTAVGGWLRPSLHQSLPSFPRIPPTAVGGWLRPSLHQSLPSFPRIPPTAVGGSLKSSLRRIRRLDFKYPPTAVGGITLIRCCGSRSDFNHPPTAVGGIILSRLWRSNRTHFI